MIHLALLRGEAVMGCLGRDCHKGFNPSKTGGYQGDLECLHTSICFDQLANG